MASSNLSARLAVLDLLWRRGFPATMATPAGLLPAILVWVNTPEHPVLRMLPRAFGGHLWLEMRDHHGEESPAFWVGVGRSAVLALGVLSGALAAADRLVGVAAGADAGTGAGMAWGAAAATGHDSRSAAGGRSATGLDSRSSPGAGTDAGSNSAAASYAPWPPRSELLGESADRAWRQLEAFSATRLRAESGAPACEGMAGEAGALEAWVAAAFDLAPHISGSLNTAMLSTLRAERSAVDLALPTRRERDAWAAAFLAPLLGKGAARA